MLARIPKARISWLLRGAVIRFIALIFGIISTILLLFAHFPESDPENRQADLERQLAELRQENLELRGQIAGHQETEKLLVEERNLLRTLIDFFPDMLFAKDTASRLIMVNRALLKHVGASDFSDVLGKTDFDLFLPHLAEQFYADDKWVIETGEMLVGKIEENQGQSNDHRWVMTTKVPLRDSDGQIIGLLGIGRDVTERKQAEIDLQTGNAELEQRVVERTAELTSANTELQANIVERQRVEEQLRYQADLLQNVSDAIISTDMDFNIQSWNRAATTIYGWEESEILGKNSTKLIYANFSEATLRQFIDQILKEGSWQGELVHKHKDGRLLHIFTSVSLMVDRTGKPVGIVGVDRDISDRKQAELAEREQRMMADALRDTASSLNRTLNLNEVLERILIQVQRVLPHETSSIMLVENGVARVVHSRGLIEHGVTQEFLTTVRFPLSDYSNLQIMKTTGQPFLVEDTSSEEQWSALEETNWIRCSLGAPIRVEGAVIGFLHLDSATPHAFSHLDAEKLLAFADQAAVAMHNARLYDAVRRHADELEVRVAERTAELERERAQLLTILDAMTEGVVGIMYDASGQPALRYINHAFGVMLGYSADEWDMMRLQTANTSDEEAANILKVYAQAMLTEGYWSEELTLTRKDGTQFDASLTVNWVNDLDGTIIGEVTVIRDVSQEKVLEEQRSRFVANASHELRTPITNLLTRLYLLRKQPERLDEHLEILENVSVRMRNLVEDLLEFSRFERGVIPLKPSVIDLRLLVIDVIRIQAAEADKKRIKLQYQSPESPLQIMADPERIAQVFTNLVTNAINYTMEGGNIDVDFAVESASDSNVPKVAVYIQDTGVGIPPEFLPYIFEPFYRANDRSKGTGLGLSITKEIIQMHGGTIQVESTLGGGSCFIVRLNLVPPMM